MNSDVVSCSVEPRRPAVWWAGSLALCFVEARPVVQVIFLTRFVAGAALAWHGSTSIVRISLGIVCWECATLAAYLYNGVTDIAEDRINGSRRPIARGDLDPEIATTVACGAAAVAAALGFALGRTTGLLVTIFLLCGYAYSGRPFCLKQATGGTVGAVIVSGLATYAGGYSVAAGPDISGSAGLLIFPVAMSLWMGLVGGLTKDFSDITGDLAAGRRSAVVALGQRGARVAVVVAAVSLGALFILAAAWYAPRLLPSSVTMQVGAFGTAVVALSRCSSGSRARRRRPYRCFMVTQYGVHLALFGAIVGCSA